MSPYLLSLRLQVPVDFSGEDVVVGPECFQKSMKWRQKLVVAGQEFNKLECAPTITIDDGLVYQQDTVVATFTGLPCSTELGPEDVEFLEWLALRHPTLVGANALENSPAILATNSTWESEQFGTSPQKLTAVDGVPEELSAGEKAPESLNPGYVPASAIPPPRSTQQVRGRETDFGVVSPEPVTTAYGSADGLDHNNVLEQGSDEGYELQVAEAPASSSELTFCDPDPTLPAVGVEEERFFLEGPVAESTEIELAEFLVESFEDGDIVELSGRFICIVREESNDSMGSWLDRSFEQSQSDGTAILVAKLMA